MPPYFVVARGHNILEDTKRLFAAGGHNILIVTKPGVITVAG